MRSDSWVIGIITTCANCKWKSEDYINGLAEARHHARLTGHKVTAKQTRIYEYYHYKGKET